MARLTVVHGYRFNLFFNDLIDLTRAPTYKLEPIPGNPDWAILRFRAGPPYLDIAFKVGRPARAPCAVSQEARARATGGEQALGDVAQARLQEHVRSGRAAAVVQLPPRALQALSSKKTPIICSVSWPQPSWRAASQGLWPAARFALQRGLSMPKRKRTARNTC